MPPGTLAARALDKARRLGLYGLQKSTGFRYDPSLERSLAEHRDQLLKEPVCRATEPLSHPIASLDLEDGARFRLHRRDPYKTFEPAEDGPERDEFGRPGHWRNRGVMIYQDLVGNRFIKTFSPAFVLAGEGRFLEEALRSGFYEHLCPLFDGLFRDEEGRVVGYAIRSGRPLTAYEFERYVSTCLRPLVCRATTESGFYFYDLIDHNTIIRDGRISLIDLESVLPVEWFGKPPEFALQRRDVLDVGWPLHTKWRSPGWYAAHIRKLQRQAV